jgi:hypothetical protein
VAHVIGYADIEPIQLVQVSTIATAPGLAQAPKYSSQYLTFAVVGTFRDQLSVVETNAIYVCTVVLAVMGGVGVEVLFTARVVSAVRKGIK